MVKRFISTATTGPNIIRRLMFQPIESRIPQRTSIGQILLYMEGCPDSLSTLIKIKQAVGIDKISPTITLNLLIEKEVMASVN